MLPALAHPPEVPQPSSSVCHLPQGLHPSLSSVCALPWDAAGTLAIPDVCLARLLGKSGVLVLSIPNQATPAALAGIFRAHPLYSYFCPARGVIFLNHGPPQPQAAAPLAYDKYACASSTSVLLKGALTSCPHVDYMPASPNCSMFPSKARAPPPLAPAGRMSPLPRRLLVPSTELIAAYSGALHQVVGGAV